MEGHKGWVMYVAFSPDCTIVASAGMDNNLILWNAKTGE
jgi:ribosome assembly protein 4